MANGTYGIVRPADITPDDVEIFYHFTPSRDSIGNVTLKKLDPSSDYLIKIDNPNKVQSQVSGFELFGGMYTLKLPTATFSTKGFYTIIIKPIDQFYNFKYKDYWIENHKKNILLNAKSCWELNMLWSEKIWFVNETIERKYFETEFYGWSDIGYFRNRPHDTHTQKLLNWSNSEKIMKLDKNKICYACINNDNGYINNLLKIVNNKNQMGLPLQQIPSHQNSIAGGFFIIHKDKIDWWKKTYDTKLELYFKNNYLVKDDQIILVDCILSNLTDFTLFRENNSKLDLDNWFMFQRILADGV
jgi:hypothetical protein